MSTLRASPGASLPRDLSGPLEHGEVDGVDLVVGIVLLVLVPMACYALAAVFGPQPPQSQVGFGQKAEIKPRPDAEEVEMRWKALEESYSGSARYFTEKALSGKLKPTEQEQFRGWAQKSLEKSRSDLGAFTVFLEANEVKTEFLAYDTKARALMQSIDADLARIRSLDVLGRDSGR